MICVFFLIFKRDIEGWQHIASCERSKECMFHKYSNDHTHIRGFGNQWGLSIYSTIFMMFDLHTWVRYVGMQLMDPNHVDKLIIPLLSFYLKHFIDILLSNFVCLACVNNHLISAHNIAYKKEPIIGFSK